MLAKVRGQCEVSIQFDDIGISLHKIEVFQLVSSSYSTHTDTNRLEGSKVHFRLSLFLLLLLITICSDRCSMSWLVWGFEPLKSCENVSMIGSLPSQYRSLGMLLSCKQNDGEKL